MSEEVEPATWHMLGTKICSLCRWWQLPIWLIDTHLENTKPVPLAPCPRCDQLVVSDER